MADEWAVVTPKGQLRMSELPLALLPDLEEQTGDEWWNIAAHPYRRAKVALCVYRTACEHLGAEPLELKLGDLPDVFVQVGDEIDDMVFEGGVPKSEDASATTGSSGAPSDSGGRQTSLDVNASET